MKDSRPQRLVIVYVKEQDMFRFEIPLLNEKIGYSRSFYTIEQACDTLLRLLAKNQITYDVAYVTACYVVGEQSGIPTMSFEKREMARLLMMNEERLEEYLQEDFLEIQKKFDRLEEIYDAMHFCAQTDTFPAVIVTTIDQETSGIAVFFQPFIIDDPVGYPLVESCNSKLFFSKRQGIVMVKMFYGMRMITKEIRDHVIQLIQDLKDFPGHHTILIQEGFLCLN